ncbi:aldo/keto reductase [Qaidamihabitans albus]|uniref:aldo/keto reductase n=1 Tax=Qaidamihabitans albus TaxID=2795733 RepID=UPI0018F1EDA8|nr:aldo/keto reductase [Qaidamihabitans albus]
MNNTARTAVGLAALGRPAYLNLGRVGELPAERDVAAMRAATHDVLDEAYAAGVRRVDVARSYGRAEEFLAQWLDARGTTDVTVSSKWGYAYVGDWRLDAAVHEVKEHSLSRFRQQWRESQELLGEVISLYQVHSLTADSPLFSDEPLLAGLAELAGNGVRVGFSTSGPAQADTIRRALELSSAGQPVFTAVQATWNLLEPSAAPALAEAHAAGTLVQLKETLANGRLAVDPPRPIAELAGLWAVPADAVALAAAFAQPWADVVLTGPASRAQLAANLNGAELSLTAEELGTLSGLAESPADYWAHRSSLTWR